MEEQINMYLWQRNSKYITDVYVYIGTVYDYIYRIKGTFSSSLINYWKNLKLQSIGYRVGTI